LSPGRGERILFGSELSRGPQEPCRGRRAAQEVGLDLSNHAATELDVAAARAFVALAGLAAAEARRDVFGDDSSGRFGEHTGLCDWSACDVAERVDTWEAGRKVVVVDGHPAVNRQAGALNHIGDAMDGNSYEHVAGQAAATCEPGLSAVRVELGHALVGYILDLSLVQGSEEGLRKLLRDRHRCSHRADNSDLDLWPHSTLREVIVQEKRALERRGRALEGVAEDPDEDRSRIEVGEGVTHSLGSRDGVVLEAAVLESRGGRDVVVGPERDCQDVCIV
jgi:hypothetical protein